MKELKLTIPVPGKEDAKRLGKRLNKIGKDIAFIGRLSIAAGIAALSKGTGKLADKIAPYDTEGTEDEEVQNARK